MKALVLMTFTSLADAPPESWRSPLLLLLIAKDCLLTLVKSRLALGSPGCSVVRDHAENGPIHRKMVVACPLVITSKVKFFFRPNKTRKGEWMVQPVFCIVDAGSCSMFTQATRSVSRMTNWVIAVVFCLFWRLIGKLTVAKDILCVFSKSFCLLA